MLSRFALPTGRWAARDGVAVIATRSKLTYPWDEPLGKKPSPEEQAVIDAKAAKMSIEELKDTYKALAPLDVHESPERDYKNFPNPRPLDDAPVRHGWIPESWFQLFYKTTGVTGPYLFAATFGTFLCSKEYFIFSFETNILFTGGLFLYYVTKKTAPGVNKFLEEEQQGNLDTYKEYEVRCKEELQNTINHYAQEIKNGDGIGMLYTAKRENVGLQLEAEYRDRVNRVYTEVKKRLDYQVETDNVKRRVEQDHMVNWIIDNVKKSITPEQEKQNMAACIARLKSLSVAA